MVVAGNGKEDLIAYLRAEGGDKIESIAVLREALNVNLGEAKRLVHCSPTWADVRQRDDEFHDQFSTIPGTQEGQ
jgi:ribosomal protein L7/L12